MKLFLTTLMLVFAFSSFAAWNEVECAGKFEGKSLSLEIEQSFPNDSHFKRADLTITENGTDSHHSYTVARRTFGFNRFEYSGAGLRLDVDLWPDQRPRWGRTYEGTLLSAELGNKYIRGLRCRFPNAY